MTAAPWHVPPDHPSFPGHFPGDPILPGAVLLDHALAWALATFPDRTAVAVRAARFMHPIRPGETVRFAGMPSGDRLEIEALIDDRIAARFVIALSL